MAVKTKILVTGADGQLGRCIRDVSAFHPEVECIFTDVAQLDITDKNRLVAYVQQEKPQWIVNAAAYTAVDKAESDEKTARLLNVTAVEYLVEAAKTVNAGLIQISTDYVFPGDIPEPLDETALRKPLSVYGQTKMESEDVALQYEKSVVLRTSWLYSEYGNNFVKTMRRLAKDRSELSVVSDQWGTPTSAHDLAKAIFLVIEKQTPSYGLFNFSNEGLTCWALFAEEIFNRSGIKCVVKHISSDEYKSAARRPLYSILSKKKFSKTFKIDIPEWEVSLSEVIHRLDELEK